LRAVGKVIVWIHRQEKIGKCGVSTEETRKKKKKKKKKMEVFLGRKALEGEGVGVVHK